MKRFAGLAILILALTTSILLLFSTYIPRGCKGIRLIRCEGKFGVQDYILSSGLSWRIPFHSEIQVIRIQPESFDLENGNPIGSNPHRNALYIKNKTRQSRRQVTVTYEINPNFLVDYGKSFFGVKPKTVVEGTLRAVASNAGSMDFGYLTNRTNQKLARFGLYITSITEITKKPKPKKNKDPKMAPKKGAKNPNHKPGKIKTGKLGLGKDKSKSPGKKPGKRIKKISTGKTGFNKCGN